MKTLKVVGLIGMAAGAVLAGAICYLLNAKKETGLDDFVEEE